jgi:hypothetical protein
LKIVTLLRHMRSAIIWHDKFPRNPGKRFRGAAKGNRRNTPNGIHPIWGAITILQEISLPEKLRWLGFIVLCYHDIPEDTLASPPRSLSKKAKEYIEAMTFSSFDEEVLHLWEKPIEIRLFKLYDKCSNRLDSDWMYPERRALHKAHLLKLADDVEVNYGKLNIVLIARALANGKD